MVTASEVAPGLLKALGVAAAPDEQQEEGEYFPQVSDAARALIRILEEGKRPEKGRLQAGAAALRLAEKVLVEGEPDAKILIIVGFLEDLVDWAGHDLVAQQSIRGELGERSREAWDKLAVLWQSRKSLLDLFQPDAFFAENPKELEFEDWMEEFIRR